MRLKNKVEKLEFKVDEVLMELRYLRERTAAHGRELDGLHTNGVATAVNKLNAEVFKDKKEATTGRYANFYYLINGVEPELGYEATLSGKVDAIIEHLGLEVSVKPEEVTESKVEAKKKKVTKKGKK